MGKWNIGPLFFKKIYVNYEYTVQKYKNATFFRQMSDR